VPRVVEVQLGGIHDFHRTLLLRAPVNAQVHEAEGSLPELLREEGREAGREGGRGGRAGVQDLSVLSSFALRLGADDAVIALPLPFLLLSKKYPLPEL
jgi:hypothetical protein